MIESRWVTLVLADERIALVEILPPDGQVSGALVPLPSCHFIGIAPLVGAKARPRHLADSFACTVRHPTHEHARTAAEIFRNPRMPTAASNGLPVARHGARDTLCSGVGHAPRCLESYGLQTKRETS
ncbi:hypothetical protein [Burkholderia cepacia]|uniref:hypothetical protein n=1 Tax=Burkholderia cepacia TaxID=292 RepID=UPI0012D8769B|nr:hypothetical protein [Burkholderia cepacia]